MGFWYTDAQDHTGAWYWIGIAISLAQSLGLHRCPQLAHLGVRRSEALQRLSRRVWWTCLIRDRWVSLAKGRPMRIHHEDCDVPMPVAEDILQELNSVSVSARDKFVPRESALLAQMWIRFVRISSSMGQIMRLNYRVSGPKPGTDEVDRCAEELDTCAQNDMALDGVSDLVRLHWYQLEMFYQ